MSAHPTQGLHSEEVGPRGGCWGGSSAAQALLCFSELTLSC